MSHSTSDTIYIQLYQTEGSSLGHWHWALRTSLKGKGNKVVCQRQYEKRETAAQAARRFVQRIRSKDTHIVYLGANHA